jgi:probable rRNA maturation factor
LGGPRPKGGSSALPERTVRRIVRAVLSGERRVADISVIFVGLTRMRRLNRDWKSHDRPTDVLSFALPLPGGSLTGEVYICAAVARTEARAHEVPLREELVRLVVHGTLHVLGYEHSEGAGRTRSAMWRRQERYVKALA